MWIFVVTSFTRYNKIGRENQKKFEKEVMKDGFYHLHSNLYVRYCVSSKNAVVHKARVKKAMPDEGADISILMLPGNMEQNIFHSLRRRRNKKSHYAKPSLVEFF